MKHPASWESNLARRTYLVVAFPIIVVVIFIAAVIVEIVDAIGTVWNEVRYSMGLTFANINKMWNQPLK